ncbi:MAG TPA: HIT family protein [Desulfonatronum sp.]|nr:HIT family protein [Desulfonatronum sp.]
MACIFCEIVQGRIPCAQVYATDTIMAFLDIAPVRPGHVLVIPKAHYPTIEDIPTDLGNELLTAVQRISVAIRRAVDAQGLNVMMNNHRAAGQLVDHAHFHLIPRHEHDGLQLWPQSAYQTPEQMHKIADSIKAAIG